MFSVKTPFLIKKNKKQNNTLFSGSGLHLIMIIFGSLFSNLQLVNCLSSCDGDVWSVVCN